MRWAEALEKLRTHDAGIRAFGVSRLTLFGSRDEARPDSNVDIPGEFERSVATSPWSGSVRTWNRSSGVESISSLQAP